MKSLKERREAFERLRRDRRRRQQQQQQQRRHGDSLSDEDDDTNHFQVDKFDNSNSSSDECDDERVQSNSDDSSCSSNEVQIVDPPPQQQQQRRRRGVSRKAQQPQNQQGHQQLHRSKPRMESSSSSSSSSSSLQQTRSIGTNSNNNSSDRRSSLPVGTNPPRGHSYDYDTDGDEEDSDSGGDDQSCQNHYQHYKHRSCDDDDDDGNINLDDPSSSSSSSDEEPYYMAFSQVANPHRYSSTEKTQKKKKKKTKKKSMADDVDSLGSDSTSSSSSSSSSSSCSSSDDGGYEPDDPRIDKRKEPLRPGDVIRYQLPVFTAGTDQGINQAVVIETDPFNSKSSVKLSSRDYLPNDTYVQRIQEYKDKTLYPHRGGCLKPLSRFKMKNRSLPQDELTTILSSYNKSRKRHHSGTLTDRAQQFKDVCNELEKTAVEYLAGKHNKNLSNDKIETTNDNKKSKSNRPHISSRKSKPDGGSSTCNNSPSRTQDSSQVTSDSASLSSSSSSDDDHECRQKNNGAAPLKLRRHHNDQSRRLNLGSSSKTTSSRRHLDDPNEPAENKNNNIEEIADALLGLSRSSTTTSSGTARTPVAAATSTTDTSTTQNNNNLSTDTLLLTKTSPRKALSVKDNNINKPNNCVGQPTNGSKHHTGRLIFSSSDSSDDSDDNSDDSMLLQIGRPSRSDDKQDNSIRQTASLASQSHTRSSIYSSKRTNQNVSSELQKKTWSSSSSVHQERDGDIHRGRQTTESVASVESLNDLSRNTKNHPRPRKELKKSNADPTKNPAAAESTSTKTGMFSLSKLNCNGKNSGNKRLDVNPSPVSSPRSASSKSLRRRRSSGVMKQIQENYQPLQIELKPGFAAAYERLEERKRMRTLRREERLAAEEAERTKSSSKAKSSSKRMKTDRDTHVRKMKNSKKKDSKETQRSRDLLESRSSSADSPFSTRRNPDRRGRPLSLLPNSDRLRTTTDETSEEEFDWSPSDEETKLSIKRDKSRCLDDNDDDEGDNDSDVLILGKPRDNQSRSNTNKKLSPLSTVFSDNDAENDDDEDESDNLSDIRSRPIARKRSLAKMEQTKRKSIVADEKLVESQSPPKRRKKKETDVKSSFSSKVFQMSRAGMRTKKKKKASSTARSRHRIVGLSVDREEASQHDHRRTSETKPSVQGKAIQHMDIKHSRELDIKDHDRFDGVSSSATSTTSREDIELLTPPPQRKNSLIFFRRSSSKKPSSVGKSYPSSGEKSVFDFDGKDANDNFDSIKKRQISLSLKRRGSGTKRR